MRNLAIAAFVCLAAAVALVWGQREQFAPSRDTPTWEYRALLPQETRPGVYTQVDWFNVVSLGSQGWELVSVTPYVIRNDERQYKSDETPKVVTQNYLAYYFRRPRVLQR
jgi:hypothetical protein